MGRSSPVRRSAAFIRAPWIWPSRCAATSPSTWSRWDCGQGCCSRAATRAVALA
jgi:hypothetical protein